MKKFWTNIKHKRKDIVGISSLKMDGKLYCDPVTKSNILNRQFKSAFSEKTSYTTEEFLNSNRMNSTTTQHPNMKSFDIICNGITKLLKQLNPYKAPGPDNISPRTLKELATDISPLLQLLVTGSQYSLPSIFSGEIPTMSLRLCLIYVQNFFIPDRGSLSSGVTT
jgi:hypothetical protein